MDTMPFISDELPLKARQAVDFFLEFLSFSQKMFQPGRELEEFSIGGFVLWLVRLQKLLV